MTIKFVYNRMPHHGAHAGYDQVAAYLCQKGRAERLSPLTSPLVPGRVWEWLARRAGMPWYEPSSPGLEAAAALTLVFGHGDVCHVLYGEDSYRYLALLGRWGRRRGSKLVCTYHQPPGILEKVVPNSAIFESLDAIVTVASNQVDYFRTFVGPERVFLVPHGVDTNFFQPAQTPGQEGMRCLFVGQWLRDFAALKGTIDTMAHTDPDVRFTVVTTDEYAPGFAGLANVAVATHVSDADLLSAYQHADALVLPLTDATANNALLEGLACGLPVVTTDVGGVRDYVTPECGFLVPPGDVRATCQAIRTLKSDSTLKATMSRHSRNRALRFDWHLVGDQLLGILDNLSTAP